MRISDWSSDVCSSDLAPAGVRIGLIGLLEALGRRHRAVIVTCAAFEVARLVDRKQYFFAEFSRLGQHRRDHVGGRVGETGQVRIAFDPEHIVEEEKRVLHGSAIDGHGKSFRSEEHTSELQSLMRISYAVFCLKKKN